MYVYLQLLAVTSVFLLCFMDSDILPEFYSYDKYFTMGNCPCWIMHTILDAAMNLYKRSLELRNSVPLECSAEAFSSIVYWLEVIPCTGS